MEGRTEFIRYLFQEIQKRQIEFTDEDIVEIDFDNPKYYIIV
jgi:hypothetical protein